MKRASSILLSLVLVLGLAACGDTGGDEGSDSGPTTTEAGAGEETTGTTDGGDPDTTGGGAVGVDAIENAEVAEYCRQVEAFIEEYADALADPYGNPDMAMEMVGPAGDLLDAVAAIDTTELSRDDVAALNACAQQLTDAQAQG